MTPIYEKAEKNYFFSSLKSNANHSFIYYI